MSDQPEAQQPAPVVEAPATGTPPAETPAAPEPVKPTETVDFWKAKAREQETRAKSNADKAKQFDDYQDAQKTEQQRLTDQLQAAKDQATQFEQQLARTQVESQRNALAAQYGIGPDYFRYIVGETPEEREEAAVGIAQMLQAAKGQQPTAPPTGRTQEQLRPGASPSAPVVEDDAYPQHWLPTRRQT